MSIEAKQVTDGESHTAVTRLTTSIEWQYIDGVSGGPYAGEDQYTATAKTRAYVIWIPQ